jgi:thiamine-phosphate pyrophosphorylase
LVFRHYSLASGDRRRLFRAVRVVARRRRLVLLVAGSALAGADGRHGVRGRGLITAPAHDLAEVKAAERLGADLIFLSPVFSTRSHPGGRNLGRVRFGLIASRTATPIIALGGMTAERARGLRALGAYGWAAIDAWSSA